jgi:hypothetical protein
MQMRFLRVVERPRASGIMGQLPCRRDFTRPRGFQTFSEGWSFLGRAGVGVGRLPPGRDWNRIKHEPSGLPLPRRSVRRTVLRARTYSWPQSHTTAPMPRRRTIPSGHARSARRRNCSSRSRRRGGWPRRSSAASFRGEVLSHRRLLDRLPALVANREHAKERGFFIIGCELVFLWHNPPLPARMKGRL